MTWREHAWDFVVYALSWIIAIVALACLSVFVFVVISAGKRRGSQKRG